MTTMESSLENKLIVFAIDENEYAISVQYVGAIEVVLPITRVPNAPEHVKGVINLRGVVTPVIDLKEKFHGKKTEFTEHTRIIVVYKEDITVGLLVDHANDVIDIQAEQLEEQPETVQSEMENYIEGVVKVEDRIFILLAITQIMEEQASNTVSKNNSEASL